MRKYQSRVGNKNTVDDKMLPAVITEPANWKKLPKPVKKAAIYASVGSRKAGRHFKSKVVDKLHDGSAKVRGRVIGWTAMMAALLLAAGLQFNWYQGIYQTVTATRGGTYAEGTLGKISSLNPLFATTRSENAVARLVFSQLYNYDTSGSLKGDLAEKLEIQNEGREYVVTVRKDAKWHDGESVDANDVVFTLGLVKNSKTGSALYGTWRDVKVEKTDEHKIKFTLPATLASFPDSLTFPVLPQHILGEVEPEKIYENEFSRAPIGSGPFEFRSLSGSSDNQSAHLSASDNYYLGEPLLDRFVVHPYLSREEIASALNGGEISGSAELAITELSDITNGNINVRETLVNSGVFAFLNTKSTILSDVRIRRAIQKGVNTNTLRDDVTTNLEQRGLSAQTAALTPLNLPILPSQIQVNVDLASYRYDLEGAKNLFNDATGDKQTTLRLVTSNRGILGSTADNFKRQLEQIGFTVDLEIVDPAAPGQDFQGNVIAPRAYDILIYEIEMGSDPDMFAYYYSGNISQTGFNLSNWSSSVVDEQLLSARATTDNALRTAKYEAFVRRWLTDVPAVGLYQAKMTYLYNKNVAIFSPNSTLISPLDRFSDILYWSANSDNVFRTP